MIETRPGYLAQLQAKTKEELINDIYNDRVGSLADFEKGDSADDTTTGKRIPYIGWFWRYTDFAGKRISIGNTGKYIGVMENNKWGYPEREMSEEEATTFIGYLDEAFAVRAPGGEASQRNAEKIFAEMRTWFQSLKVQR